MNGFQELFGKYAPKIYNFLFPYYFSLAQAPLIYINYVGKIKVEYESLYLYTRIQNNTFVDNKHI